MSVAARRQDGTARGASVTLHGITRSFGETSVLEGVDLEIKPGEFVAIIGQSGSGKSTLLRIIAGLDNAYKGQLAIDASKGHKTAARIMYQEPRLLPWASVIENVAFGLGPQASRHQAFAHSATQSPSPLPPLARCSRWHSTLPKGMVSTMMNECVVCANEGCPRDPVANLSSLQPI
jgi:sulfonate transport system ATP-binding protein